MGLDPQLPGWQVLGQSRQLGCFKAEVQIGHWTRRGGHEGGVGELSQGEVQRDSSLWKYRLLPEGRWALHIELGEVEASQALRCFCGSLP